MSNFGDHPTGFFGQSEFYNGVVANSLRFGGSDGTLTRTLGTTSGSRRKNVWSFWTKFGYDNSANPYFYSKGNGGGVADIVYISITSSQRLNFIGYISDSVTHEIVTARELRDPSAWYHIAIAVDTTQGTASDRIQIYINGVKETAFDTATYPSQNADLAMNWYSTANAGTTVEQIGDYYASQNAAYRINGYLAEYHSVDGLSFFSDTSGTANTSFNINSFVEIKNGVCIPVEYTGAHGTQGYHLKFDNTSVGSGSSSTVGADSSGQNNHWTSNNIVAADCNIPDCPENNFCTMNPNVQTNDGDNDLSEGNLKITKVGTTYSYYQSTFGVKTGKWYAEIRVNAKTDGYFMIGVTEMNMETYRTTDSVDPHLTAGTVWYSDNGYGHYDGSGVSISEFSGGNSFNTNQVVGIALDLDSGTRTVKFYVDGSLATSQNLPASMIDHIGFACNWYNNHTGMWNFGQDSSFNGDETATNNSDANGNGTFHTAVPSGYLALCTANFDKGDYASIGPDSSTQADNYFNSVLYTGDASSRSITGVGFQPDWIWIKPRSENDNHVVLDSSRGGTKYLMPNRTDAEISQDPGITAFGTDGFSIGNWTNVNKNSQTYVAWNWKANGGTTTTNDASATSIGTIDSVYQANTTAGFSIVLYTGNATSGATVAHGLGAIPDWYFVKRRSNSGDWLTYHSANTTAPQTDFLKLNEGNATEDNAVAWNDVAPTSTVFSLGNSVDVNENANTYIAYCFANIEGYSKFGAYTGNGNNDGAFVYTGFKPAWVLIKNTARSADWRLHDIARQPINDAGGHILFPNTNVSEVTNEYDIDFVSNGFKLRSSDVYENGTGELLIYAAFAKVPFKYSNAH